MGKIINSYILPHPPIIVPGVGKGREKDAIATIEAVEKVAKEIAKDNPTTIILSSPHAPCFRDYVYISDKEVLSGNFGAFGFEKDSLKFKNNTEMVSSILDKAVLAGISSGGLSRSQKRQYGISDMLDHGALVPLYFISRELGSFKLVHISTPFMAMQDIYKFGKCIAEAVISSKENVVYVASGDLSHRLTEDAPGGYNSKGREYDQYLIDKLKKADVAGLLDTEEDFMEAAGECGTRSFIMMLGVLDGFKINTDIYSYEGPFGVGYLAAKVSVLEKGSESDYVKLARESLETFIKEKKRIAIPKWLPNELLNTSAGVFVSIKKSGNLRGCIGTIAPTRENVAQEIISNAINSGTEDPRFEQVREDEIPELEYSVDVLRKPENINSIDELDVSKYGVIVTSRFRRGLLLPELEGVDTPEEQVAIALRKAGIGEFEDYKMERFEVVRYK